jgi:hypothetical protein
MEHEPHDAECTRYLEDIGVLAKASDEDDE